MWNLSKDSRLISVPRSDATRYSLLEEYSQKFLWKCTLYFLILFSYFTSSSVFLNHHLVVRRHRSLHRSRLAGSMSNSIFSLVIRFSLHNLENICFEDHKNALLVTAILNRRFPTFRIHCIMFLMAFNACFIYKIDMLRNLFSTEHRLISLQSCVNNDLDL